ncbi:MAG TPA: hypothetical protein PKX92_10365 [Edaphocola sp.]|nr:hypothetical protein [Edaphocola sp.]
MKKNLLICLMMLLGQTSKAQLKHSFAFDYIIYGNVFSPPQKNFFYKENYRFVWPQLTYTIQKDKQRISFSALGYGKEPIYYDNLMEGDLWYYRNGSISLSYGYEIISNEISKINLNGGLNFGIYHHSYIQWFPFIDKSEAILDGGKEWTLGFTVGVNPQFKIWKGLFLNSNLRYTINPIAIYKKHFNTLYVGVGLGYEFGKRKR